MIFIVKIIRVKKIIARIIIVTITKIMIMIMKKMIMVVQKK